MLDKQEKIEREGLLRNIETIIGKIVDDIEKLSGIKSSDVLSLSRN